MKTPVSEYRASSRLLLAVMLCACPVSGPARAGISVRLRATATVSGDYVRLESVAAVRGDGDARPRVAGLYLGPVPPAGESRRLTRAQVRDRLLEVGLAKGVALRGAEAVIITRASGHAPHAPGIAARTTPAGGKPRPAQKHADRLLQQLVPSVRSAVLRYLRATFNRRDLEARIIVRDLDAAGAPPAGARLLLQDLLSGRLPGRARVRLARADGHADGETRLTAQVEARVFAPVFLLRRNLARGHRLQPGDLLLRRAELKAGVAYMPLDAEALAGKETARYLRALRPLVEGDLVVPAAVIKNQLVTVNARTGGFLVTQRVRALAAGRPGELVEVENLDSGKHFMVQVTGFGAARLPQASKER